MNWNDFQVATLLPQKTKLPSFYNSRAQLGENIKKFKHKFSFQFLYDAKFVWKKGRFLANEKTGFSSRELTKLTFFSYGHNPVLATEIYT